MPQKKRKNLIAKIEKERGSKVLCYLTGDRRGLETRIHPEIQTMFYEHLQACQGEKIDLFLYSTGGVTMAAWGIVSLIREFCKTFSVIVPFKAHSTATLICLGADEIVMGKLGQLGPVDPSVQMAFNPPVAGRPGQVLPISVEEVSSFFDLAKDARFLGLKSEAALGDVLKQLTAHVHPLALGSVYRATEQIRLISKRLLSTHMKYEDNGPEIDRIIGAVTKTLYSHDYIINRKEAKNELKLNVTEAEEIGADFVRNIYDLFKLYEDEMKLTTLFNPEAFLGADNTPKSCGFTRAFIESAGRTDCFITEKVFQRVQQGPPVVPIPQMGIQENLLKEEWEQVREEV